MVIYAYSLPAMLALMTKVGLLVYAVRSPIRDMRAVVFSAALLASVVTNVIEVGIIQGIYADPGNTPTRRSIS